MKTGIVLTGGGARAAYQVGVLRAISDILKVRESPFAVISGFSAGAINGLWLAAKSDDFEAVVQEMWTAWSSIKVENVYRTDTFSLMGISSGWIRDLSFGGLFGKSRSTYLLDNSPLAQHLKSFIDFSQIRKNIEAGLLHGVSLSATNYLGGVSTAFFQGHREIQEWSRENRIGVRSEIKIDHLMASLAIPIFFPPVKLDHSFFGDGMVHLQCPLSPVIHLGAEQILSIGLTFTSGTLNPKPKNQKQITVGDIVETLLNGLFFGTLNSDRERLGRINRTLEIMTINQRHSEPDHLRKIPTLSIDPSESLGAMANFKFNNFPLPLRHLLRGLGISGESGSDILSYLAFDSVYTKALLELGYKDGLNRRSDIQEFFNH